MSNAPSLIAAKMGILANAIIGKTASFVMPRGYTATPPLWIDDSLRIPPANGLTTVQPQGKATFNFVKNSQMIGKCWVEIRLTAGASSNGYSTAATPYGSYVYSATLNAPAATQPVAAYVKNVGDLIANNHQLIYGNAQLQVLSGRHEALYRRICCNDVNIEATNAQVLGGLPPGGAAEAVLVDAFYNGVTLYIPLEDLFFVKSKDRHWMTEAYALEGQLQTQFESLGNVIVRYDRNAGFTGNTLTLPTIVDVNLRYQEFTVSAAEKENRLKLYKSPEGLVNLFTDLEPQLDNPLLTGVAARANGVPLSSRPLLPWNIQLSNLRMDMKEIVFVIHRVGNTQGTNGTGALAGDGYPGEQGRVNVGSVTSNDYAGSYMESNPTSSILYPPASVVRSFASMVPVTSFQLTANAKQIYNNTMTDFQNRTIVRKYYHRDSQIADPIYCLPFAVFPEDDVNATGSMSANVLGTLRLEIQLPDPGPSITYACELWSRSYNLMQSRAGGITAALH